ncbi:MAG TPA: hypothetical protein VK200_07155 [Candidatus Limnocylindrales bacterium]|nr:hypothetical protein [Candidatus Limnocylindrales bacterium]
MLKRFAIIVIAGTLLSAPSAYSQNRDGTLQGVVKDSQGAPVTGAFVKIKNSGSPSWSLASRKDISRSALFLLENTLRKRSAAISKVSCPRRRKYPEANLR